MKYLLPALFMLAGCMVGPKYHTPHPCLPTQFEESRGTIGTDHDLYQWWKQFNDPLLDALLCEAMEANYDLLIAIERIEQARAQYRIERSYLWPEIDFNAVATRSQISQNLFPNLSNSSGTLNLFPFFLNIFEIGFDAIWELDFFGQIRHSKRAAYYQWEATKDQAESVSISMLSEVAVNYVAIRALQKQIDLIQRKLALDEEELTIIRSLFQVGLDNELQITTLISSIESDRASLPVLETSFKQTVYALAYLLGRPPEGLIEAFRESRPIPSGSDRVPVGLPSDLLRRRPDIRSAERQLAAATEQVGVAVANFFPQVTLTGINLGTGGGGSSIGYESGDANRLFQAASRMFSIGPALRWDLIDFGRVRGTLAAQTSLQKQALLAYEQTVIASLKDVEGALVAYFDEQRRQHSLKEKVHADRCTLEITEALYRIGLANKLQVIEAQKALLMSESSLVDSEQALTSDLIALYKAIGGNWDCPRLC